MRFLVGRAPALLCVVAFACGQAHETFPLIDLARSGDATVLVAGTGDRQALRDRAEKLGLTVEGDVILEISGDAAVLSTLEVGASEAFVAVENEIVATAAEGDMIEPDETIYLLAKEDFGLPGYWLEHPTHDGRGVVVGVIDDGVSPHLEGLRKTTTGERKFLHRGSNSTVLELEMNEVAESEEGFLASIDDFDAAWHTVINEAVTLQGGSSLDLNRDGSLTQLEVAVIEKAGENGAVKHVVCIDTNANAVAEEAECFGTFAESGEYGHWQAHPPVTITAEFFPEEKKVFLSQGEASGSHGEGVASVLTGHNIGGQYDGVAPGAQLVDYDLSERTDKLDEYFYSMAKFVRGLDYMGKHGAEVINISYSLYFASADTQAFMKAALETLIEEYGFVISFSGGNNGPGLGSFNRGLLYPANVLVAGAFVGRALDEYVHGVTGLPDPGRVVYYSSRGPAPDGAGTPTVISPLASLVHKQGDGFGAFSGTSSASPALAGLAAILISAAKDEGLPIDPTAVVHAIRQSAAPLPGVPFIDQGAGLPKMAGAIAIYRRLVTGEQYARVDAQVGQDGPDGITARGVLLRTSQVEGTFETHIWTRGRLAPVAQAIAPNNLVTVDIEYSVPWITGPAHTFLSEGWSQQWIEVDIDAMLAATKERGRDHAGEIYYVDSATGQRLHTVPVTIIDDVIMDGPALFADTLGPEQGRRHHLWVPPGVPGIRVTSKVDSGNPSRLALKLYDPSARGIRSRSGSANENEFLFPTDAPGWYQLTLAKKKGTKKALDVELHVEPVNLEVASVGVAASEPRVQVMNHGDTQEVMMTLSVSPPVVSQQIVKAALDKSVVLEVPADEPGHYHVRYDKAVASDVSYTSMRCMGLLFDQNDVLLRHESPPVFVDATEVGGRIEVQCRPFEYTGLENTATLSWAFSVHRSSDSSSFYRDVAETIVKLESGLTEVSLPAFELPPDVGEAHVWVSPIFETGSGMFIGELFAF